MSDKFKVVSVNDPAIDTELGTIEQIRKYLDWRKFEDIQPFIKPGAKPTIFHCCEVPHQLWESYVLAGSSDEEKARRAFQCGVTAVENYVQEDGREIGTWTPPARGNGATKVSMMSDDDGALFPPVYRAEIGTVIFQRSFLGSRIKSACPLPPTSLAILAQRRFRLAEPSPNEQAPSSAEASSKLSASDPSSPAETIAGATTYDDKSASRTDAPATETSKEVA